MADVTDSSLTPKPDEEINPLESSDEPESGADEEEESDKT
jgi:hypothetical protein